MSALPNLENKTKEDFFKERGTASDVEGLSVLQINVIKLLQQGYSFSAIARMYNVHFMTLKKECSTVAFSNYLNTATQATNDITVGLIKKRLLKIVMTSSNENAVIKSAQVLYNMMPHMSLDILAEMVANEEIAKDRAEAIMKELGIEEEDLFND